MVKVENHCVDCGKPCLGSSCPYSSVKVYYCDECKTEITDDVYNVDGDDLCEDCLKKAFKKGR